jgi:hypothetical protein
MTESTQPTEILFLGKIQPFYGAVSTTKGKGVPCSVLMQLC